MTPHPFISALLALAALTVTVGDSYGQCLAPRRTPPTRASLLVTAKWLARHADDADLVILHAGRDRGAYEQSHIPGARFLDARMLFAGDPAGARQLQPQSLADSLRTLGLSSGSRVILYGNPLAVARAFFALDIMGHGDRVSVLDGGVGAWRGSGQSTTGARHSAEPADFQPSLERWRLVDTGWVREAVERRDVVIIDARSEEEFAAGHIPAARQLDWRLTLRGGVDAAMESGARLRSVPELRRLFRLLGIDEANEIVFYSDDGSRAAHLYFVARYLGYAPRLYAAPPGAWRGGD